MAKLKGSKCRQMGMTNSILEYIFKGVEFVDCTEETVLELISEIQRQAAEIGLLKERLEQTKSILLACSQSVDDLEARLKEVEGGGA